MGLKNNLQNCPPLLIVTNLSTTPTAYFSMGGHAPQCQCHVLALVCIFIKIKFERGTSNASPQKGDGPDHKQDEPYLLYQLMEYQMYTVMIQHSNQANLSNVTKLFLFILGFTILETVKRSFS